MADNVNSESGAQRLQELIADYLKALEVGRPLSREELLARHPDLADSLAAFFRDHDRMQGRAHQLLDPESTGNIDPKQARTLAPVEAATSAARFIRYFGDYELLEEIGRGGMGVVYKARQVSLKRTVAIKMILTGQLANEADVRRFQAEAEAAAKLDHPGIVPIFEVGQHEGHHYFSMAFVESDSLAHKIAQGLPPPRQAAELVRSVALAVAYAHVEGVIHRDLKPANILIDKSGQPRLTDFGLAKRLRSEPGASAAAGLTGTGQVLGTPSYMPPEQASGERGAVGPQADIYSLGAILYCLLTGRPPFQAANPLDTLLQVLASEPIPPRQLNAAAPRDLETICLKCLNKEPRKRYGAAQEMVSDLDRYLRGQPILARPTGLGERVGKWVKRRPAAAAALLLGLVIAIGLPLLLAALLQNAEERAKAVLDLTVAERDLTAARQNTADQLGLAKQVQANLNMAKTDLISVRGEADQQKQLAKEALHSARGLRLIGQSSGLRLNNPGLALLLAIEGQKLAPGLMANNALREAIDECHEERTIQAGNGVRSALYTPDGTQIISIPYGTLPAVGLWDAATGKHIGDFNLPPVTISSANVSPDGKRIVFTFNQQNRMKWYNNPPEIIYTDRVARVWDMATRKELAILKGHKSRLVSVDFSTDGKKLVTASWDGTVRIWDTATWTEDRVIAAHQAGATAALFSPDGRSILSASTSVRHERSYDDEHFKIKNALIDPPAGTLPPGVKPGDQPGSQGYGGSSTAIGTLEKNAVVIWDAATGKQRTALKHGPKGMPKAHDGHPPLFPLAWSPKGDQILTWSPGASNGITLWDAGTGEAHVTLSTGYQVHGLFNPDGTRALTVGQGDGKLSLWDASSGKEALVIRVAEGFAGMPSISPNGRWILCACGDKAARIWSADTGEELWCFRGPQLGFASAAFSPDATHVVTASQDGTLRIWNAQSGRDYARVMHGAQGLGQEVAFSSNGRHLATGGHDPRLWDASSGKLLNTLRGLASLGDSPARAQILGEAHSLEFSADGRHLLVATKDATARIRKPTLVGFGKDFEEEVPFTPVRLWDVETGKEVRAFRGPRGEVGRATFSPNGKLILAAESGRKDALIFGHTGNQIGRSSGSIADGQAYVWEAATGKLVQNLKGNASGITYVGWSPDSKRVLTADSYGGKVSDGAARIWDVESGIPVVKLEGDPGGFLQATFSPDGEHVLMLQGQHFVEIWDASTGQVALTLGRPMGYRYSQDRDLKTKQIVFKRNGRVVRVVEGETSAGHTWTIEHAAYSPDGHRIVTVSADKTARIWDADTGKQLLVLRGHILGLRSAAFSVDGKLVVTASDDETARVWDAQSGAELITLAGHKARVMTAVFSPDGKRVATGSRDATVRLWPIDPVPLAVSRKPRELSSEERERFGIEGPTKP